VYYSDYSDLSFTQQRIISKFLDIDLKT